MLATRALLDQVVALAGAEPPATLVALADARYRPHGGLDRIVVRLRADGGTVERMRTPFCGAPERHARTLDADEAARAAAGLAARDAWRLGDHREAVIDGLACGFALVHGERRHAMQLHSRLHESKHSELLRFSIDLASQDR